MRKRQTIRSGCNSAEESPFSKRKVAGSTPSHPLRVVGRPLGVCECHPGRKHYAWGLCRPCWQKGRYIPAVKKVSLCHPDRPHVAKGKCSKCYQKWQYQQHKAKKLSRRKELYVFRRKSTLPYLPRGERAVPGTRLHKPRVSRVPKIKRVPLIPAFERGPTPEVLAVSDKEWWKPKPSEIPKRWLINS